MIPKLLVTAALMAVQVGLQMTQKIRGPRLDNLKTTTAEYGTPINRFWGKRKFDCPIIWAEELRETRHTSKSKGGKNTQYKYFASFATLIADHEIDAITRIWMDDKLVYQTTAIGPVSVGSAAGLTVGGNMRAYLGTETQLADPRMEAWCDDRYGPDSCPAYRGSAYVVFEELPVNNFGNRIPNITIEAVNNKTDIYPWEFTEAPTTFIGKRFSPDGLKLTATTGPFMVWDVPTRQLLVAADISTLGAGSPYAFTDTGILCTSDGTSFVAISFDGSSSIAGGTFAGANGVWNAGGQYLLSGNSFMGMNVGIWSGGVVTSVAVNHYPSSYFTNTEGDPIALGTTSGNILAIGPAFSTATLINTTTYGTSGAAYGFDNGTNYVVRQGSYLFLIDKVAFTIVSAVNTSPGGPGDPIASYTIVRPGAEWWWDGLQKRDSSDLSVLETRARTDWVSSVRAAEHTDVIYSEVLNALVSFDNISDPGIIWRYLDRIDSVGVTLQTVVDTVSGWCGLTGQDSSALTQIVLGYSVTQGSGKDMIAPLLDIHDVDCRPHDFQVQFVNRGSSPSGATLLTSDFVRNDSRYKVTIKQDTDLPKDLTFNFLDWDHDQNPNNVIAERTSVGTQRSETVDLSTYADTSDGAQQKADRYLRRVWNSRESVSLSLTAQQLAIEPGDVKTISLDGTLRNVRFDKITLNGQQLDCEVIRDETTVAAINTATTGAAFEGSDADTITLPGPSRGFALDAPLVRDADNDVNPLLYVAAGSYIPDWLGAAAYRGDDGTYDDLVALVDSADEATWGIAQSKLATANPNLWDRGNSLDVSVYGTLTTATEAEINADEMLNLMALGDTGRWEYLQFATATLTGTSGNANLYTLTGFKRGRRGTEGNVGNHATGDGLLMMNKAVPVELGLGDVGAATSFKIQSLGRDPDTAPPVDLTFSGATLKPYAPARIEWVYDGTDLHGTVFRRTRVGGAWNGSTIALGETSEAYEIDVYNGVTFKRTITISGTNLFTYTSAMATADGITLPAHPTLQVFQMSSTVGRGFALAA